MAEKQPKSDLTSKQTTSRLTSLGKPRDLHLSGIGSSKPRKVFTPNLHAVRNKGKAVPNVASDGSRKNNKKQPKDFKKRESDSSRFVQSTGIFSEGTSETKRESSHASRGSDARDGGGEAAAGMEKPKIDTGAAWNIDLDEEAKIITDLLEIEGTIDEEVDHDDYQPIVLPLNKNKQNFFKTFAPQPQIGTETKIKVESTEENMNVDNISEDLSQCSFYTPKLFSDSNVTYSIVKLPDAMPGRGFDDDGKVIDYTLDQMLEGKIGKIVKRRSGKMQIIIGDMTYDFDSAEAAPFQEELMVMPEPDTPEHSASMINLGAIKERFMISPSWQNLLSEKPDT